MCSSVVSMSVARMSLDPRSGNQLNPAVKTAATGFLRYTQD
jgi:hypothetical protein